MVVLFCPFLCIVEEYFRRVFHGSVRHPKIFCLLFFEAQKIIREKFRLFTGPEWSDNGHDNLTIYSTHKSSVFVLLVSFSVIEPDKRAGLTAASSHAAYDQGFSLSLPGFILVQVQRSYIIPQVMVENCNVWSSHHV